jgi:hypothetical protein
VGAPARSFVLGALYIQLDAAESDIQVGVSARGPASVQRNFRLPVDLLERFEAVVPRSRRAATVRVAISEWLDRQVGEGPVAPAELPSDARVFQVVNAAGTGTLVRLDAADVVSPGAGLVVVKTGERIRVRRVDGDLLSVDRGARPYELRPGDQLLVREASPDAEIQSGPGGNGAGGGAGVQGGAASGVASVAAAPPSISESVELAVWLAGRIQSLPALMRRAVKEGRVSVAGEVIEDPGARVAKDRLSLVELDGERVA